MEMIPTVEGRGRRRCLGEIGPRLNLDARER